MAPEYEYNPPFNVFGLEGGNLPTCLKHEVSVVRGRRRQRRSADDDEEDDSMKADASCGDAMVDIALRVKKKSTNLERDSRASRAELERALTAFCFRFGIPMLPNGGDNELGVTVRGKGRQSSGISKPPKNSRKSSNKKKKRTESDDVQRGGGTGGPPNNAGGGGQSSDTSFSTIPKGSAATTTETDTSTTRKKRVTKDISHLIKEQQANLITERDREWLQWSAGSDTDVDEDAVEREKKREQNQSEKAIDPDLEAYITSTKLLDRINSVLGLNPYPRVVQEKDRCVLVRWDRKSWEFFGVCISSLLFFMTTISAFISFMWVSNLKEPLPASKKVIQLEFVNHISTCLSFCFITLFLSIWGVSCVMELGIHYAEFMTRLNRAICLLKYDVTPGIQRLIKRNLLFLAIFLGCMIFLFFTGKFNSPYVREAAGFLGFSVMRPLNWQWRESIYYPLLEVFGLVVFFYSFSCFDIVLLQFAVYGKTLENMARTYNLRLAYCLGKISERSTVMSSTVSKSNVIRKVIPYKKLVAEHQVVTSLLRHFGQVNMIVLYALVLTLALQNVLIMYMIFQSFARHTSAHTVEEEGYIFYIGSVTLAVPLRWSDTRVELTVNTIVTIQMFIFGFMNFTAMLHNAGDLIQVCIEYVRRHGFTLCRNSKERRFILTMINSFPPTKPDWVGRGFHFNKAFILAFLGFITAASMVMTAFHPERTGIASIQSCDNTGLCTVFSTRKSGLGVLYASVPLVTPAPPLVTTGKTPPTRKPIHPVFKRPHKELLFYSPCSSTGDLPNKMIVISHSCPASWNNPSLPSTINTPYLYKPLYQNGAFDLIGRIVMPFAAFPWDSVDCKDASEGLLSHGTTLRTSSCPSKTFACHRYPFPHDFVSTSKNPAMSCFFQWVYNTEMDDCRNLNVTTVSHPEGRRSVAQFALTFTGELPGATSQSSLLCCYKYFGVNSSTAMSQSRVCNMPNAETMNTLCSFEKRQRMTGEVLRHHNKLVERMKYQVAKEGSSINYLAKYGDRIAKCLCRFSGTPTKDEFQLCAASHLPPCMNKRASGTVPQEEIALECKTDTGKAYAPLGFLVSADLGLSIPVEHKRYAKYCKEPSFHDSFFHGDNLTYPNTIYPSDPNMMLSDCSGKKLERKTADRDDCLNWRFLTPDAGGMMKPPRVQLAFYKSVKVNMPLCCFQYAHPIFQDPDRRKFCYSPSLNAMEQMEWCGGALTKKFREPPPFPPPRPQIQEQLHEKFILTNQHYADTHGGKIMLDVPEENEKWTKCLCGNLIEGYTAAQFDSAVAVCIASTPKPCDLNPNTTISMCPHKWTALKEKIMTPKVFFSENGILGEGARFENVGNPEWTSNCLEDETWQERNHGSKTLDCFGNSLVLTPKDDCGTYPVPYTAGGSQKVPKLRLVPAATISALDFSYTNPREVHCCYQYEGYNSQLRVCNMPNAAAVRTKCDDTEKPSYRKKHELQLVRRILVDDAAFKGDLVKVSGPLQSNSPEESVWLDCICRGKGGNDQAARECQKYYLPPCMHSKTGIALITLEDVGVNCSTSWSGGDAPTFISLPVILEFTSGGFTRFNRFKQGENFQSCPSENTVDFLSTSSWKPEVATCYGQKLNPPLRRDDCGNPEIHSPSRTGVTQGQPVAVAWRLVPDKSIPGLGEGGKFYCCFKYAISLEAHASVCNMPSLPSFKKFCSDTASTNSAIADDVKHFKDTYYSSPSFWALPVDDPLRVQWVSCICEGKAAACPKPTPPTTTTPSYECKKEQDVFTSCHSTNSNNGTWPTRTFLYPKMFYKDRATIGTLHLVIPWGAQFCLNKYGMKVVPWAKDRVPPKYSEIYNCDTKIHYNATGNPSTLPEFPGFYADDCWNPSFPLRPNSMTSFRTEGARMRITQIEGKVLCCFEYDTGLGFTSSTLQQTRFCNIPNSSRVLPTCNFRSYKGGYDAVAQEFVRRANMSETQYQKSDVLVRCLCNHLQFVKQIMGKLGEVGPPNVNTCMQEFK